MGHDHFDALARDVAGFSRRAAVGMVVTGLAGITAPEIEARKRRKRRKKKTKKRGNPQAPGGVPQVPTGPLCTETGEACAVAGSTCQAQFCLQAPFTISATWSSQINHDTWLFVPPQNATTGPSPQIDYDCNPAKSRCAQAYPFACVNRDASGPGDEITTIHGLLPGTYEYWIFLGIAPAGDLKVTLTDGGGRVVRAWSSPAVSSALDGFWHVLDVDGTNGRVVSFDAPPVRFRTPVTNVCPV